MTYAKRDFAQDVTRLLPSTFEFQHEAQGFIWIRQESGRKDILIIGYKSLPGGLQLRTPQVAIAFEEIEQRLNTLYDKYNIDQRYGDFTIQQGLGSVDGVDYGVITSEIIDTDSFTKVSSELNKLFAKGAVPFFQRFNDLCAISRHINELSTEELSLFISGIVGLKVPLIKKLANAPDFLEELKERYKFYSDEVFTYPQYFKDHEKVFKELFHDDLAQLYSYRG